MKNFNVTVQAEIKVQFDENSDEFKKMWKNYLEYFNSDADYQSFSENIAYVVSKYGVQEFIEGVGYLKLNGSNQSIYLNGEYKEREAIVNIEVETDLNSMVDFEIYYTQDLSSEIDEEE